MNHNPTDDDDITGIHPVGHIIAASPTHQPHPELVLIAVDGAEVVLIVGPDADDNDATRTALLTPAEARHLSATLGHAAEHAARMAGN